MKKIICLLLLLAMLVSVVACEGDKPKSTDAPAATSNQSNEKESVKPDIPTSTATETEEPAATTEVPTATPDATEKPAEKTPEPIDRGTLTIPAVYAFVGYPASDIFTEFSKPEMAEKLTYTFDGDGIKIDSDKNTVTAVKKGTYSVTASSENFMRTFTVYAKEVDKEKVGANGIKMFDTSNFDKQAADRLSQWEKNGIDGKTTLFIGDSFFDTYFWSDFYTKHYSGKDALLLGIGSTTTYDWEVWADKWLGETSPKNIVINVGTNNVYDDGDNLNEAVLSLKRLFIVLHDKFPDAQIYWYGISQRAYDEAKKRIVSKINDEMKKWCDLCEYVTYVDATSKLTADKLRDGVHPTLDAYSLFTTALRKAGLIIENKSSS